MWDVKITFNRGLPFETSSALELDEVLDSVKTVFLEPPENRKILEFLVTRNNGKENQ